MDDNSILGTIRGILQNKGSQTLLLPKIHLIRRTHKRNPRTEVTSFNDLESDYSNKLFGLPVGPLLLYGL